VIGYLTALDPDGAPEPTFGFVVTPAAVGELFQKWYEERSLLPQPIAAEQPNDSIL
jgi:hypothetical protein